MELKQSINISENGFVFDTATGDSFSVNDTALDMLQLLKDGKTEEEIRDAILMKYDVDSLTLERNYFEFTHLLRHLNLVLKK